MSRLSELEAEIDSANKMICEFDDKITMLTDLRTMIIDHRQSMIDELTRREAEDD